MQIHPKHPYFSKLYYIMGASTVCGRVLINFGMQIGPAVLDMESTPGS